MLPGAVQQGPDHMMMAATQHPEATLQCTCEVQWRHWHYRSFMKDMP